MTHDRQDGAMQHIAAVAEAAVADGVVPGVAVAVGSLDGGPRPWRASCFGRAGDDLGPVTNATVYDLASLTKAISTSILVMQAVAQGEAALADPLRRWLPGAPAGVTVAHALTHTTGWPAHRKFYETLRPSAADLALPDRSCFADTIVDLATKTPLEAAPGSRTLYSDLGFIALGRVVEATLSAPLDELFAERISKPLCRPTLAFLPPKGAFAPTESCPWRARLMMGEVHDQNAWLMGGVAGHAGLFGTIDDVAAVAHALLATYLNRQSLDLAPAATVQAFWNEPNALSGTWALGWDRPSPTASLAGARISRRAVGHLAFTGCSLWIDVQAACFVVTLCNRIHPTVRDDQRFRVFRAAIVDAALQEVDEGRL